MDKHPTGPESGGIAGAFEDVVVSIGDAMGEALYGDEWRSVKARAAREARRKKRIASVGAAFAVLILACLAVLLLVATAFALRAAFHAFL